VRQDRAPGVGQSWWQSPGAHLQLVIVLAVALGGGGVGYGLRNAVIQLAALAVCAAHCGLVADFLRKGPRMLVVLVLLSLAVPLLQLIPLPATIWQALPGRAMVVESLALARLDPGSWQPASLDRARTLVAFCGTLAPATIIAIGARLDSKAKLHLGLTFIGAALASVLLGVMQLSTANTTGLLFPVNAKDNVLYASFANRNSTGLLFVLALLVTAALPVPRQRPWLLAIVAGGSLLLLGALLTQSRSSIALLALPLALMVMRCAFAVWTARRGSAPALTPSHLVAAGFAILVAGILAFSFISGGRAGQTLERFGTLEDDRLTMWEDGQYAAAQYWPAGSGMGTFDEVYQVYESLEYISPKKAGRMHNDFLEVSLEAGAVGLALIAAWLLWCMWQPLIGKGPEEHWLAPGASIGIIAIALQSVLDYPLRNQTLLCVAALLVVLLVRPGKEQA